MAVAALIGGVLLTAHAAENANTTDASTAVTATDTTPDTTIATDAESVCSSGWNFNHMGFGRHGFGAFGGFGQIQVSTEFEQNVTDIAKNDADVQNLLADGYNVTAVRPIITTVIDANGNVVTKATSAILMLQKDTTGRATVLVDLEQAKVTQIVIETRTVIEKP
ncbi:MAG: hypothetical protein NWE99_04215 [Candidatus Bathyarchaeota archaeon]|nr:hypothetical protein [Candidatus Bathyarchaeota archaeon]